MKTGLFIASLWLNIVANAQFSAGLKLNDFKKLSKIMLMKNFILLFILSISVTGFCTTWTINNSGFTYTPAAITVTLGDSINFVISSSHNAVEVSQTTWDANGNTALSGGFETAFGGGLVLPAQLGVGTHYYVCAVHASIGMKGIIIVQSPAGIIEHKLRPAISFYPNPSDGKFQIDLNNLQFTTHSEIEIYNEYGNKIHTINYLTQKTPDDIDLSNFPKGIYFIKFCDGKENYTGRIIIQ